MCISNKDDLVGKVIFTVQQVSLDISLQVSLVAEGTLGLVQAKVLFL